jgi:hypothetical protein
LKDFFKMGNIQNINQKLKQIAKVLTFVFVFAFTKSWGQLLQWNTFGNLGTEATEPSVFNDPGVSATNITKGAGITAAANANRFGGSAWSTSLANAVANNDYLEFVVTPTLGCTFTPTSLVFGWDRSNTGPSDVTLRSSADGFVSNLGTLTGLAAALSAGNTITITGLTNIGTTTFRLYGYGAGVLAAGTGGFDQGGSSPGVVNVQLNGSTSCGCTPPSITTQPVGVSTTSTGTASYTVVAAGTSPSYQWQESTGGPFSNIANGGSNPTYAGATSSVMTISNPPLSMSGYSYQCVVSNACGTATTNGTSTITVTAPSNAITTGAVSNPPFALTDCTITASGTVAFTSSGTFTGNTYTAELSNASGSFATPTNIGTLVSNANSGTINITIPASTASGAGYLIRVVSSSPAVTGSSSAAFTITLTCASPSGSCTVGGAMGNNEINDGCGSGAPCFLASIYAAYGNFCNNVDNTGCTSCITANVSAVYTVPSGCTASVIAEYKNRGVGCSNSAMDGGDQLYITNSGGTLIGQSASLTGCGAFSSGVSSTIASGCGNGDGVVTMTLSGGQFTVGGTVNRGDEIITYTVSFSGTCGLNCPTILPISLIDFYGTENGNDNDIFWKVASEENIRSYILEKSEDGINFREFSIQNAKGNGSVGQINYYAQDVDPSEGITYYRLSTLEGGGSWNIKNYKTISIDRNSDDWKSLFYQKDNTLFLEFKNSAPKNSMISLFDLSGKLLAEESIKNSQTKINVQNLAEGLYFVKIQSPYKTENFKIIIQK